MKTTSIILPALLAPLGALGAPTPETAGINLMIRNAEALPANSMLAPREELELDNKPEVKDLDLEKQKVKDLEKEFELAQLRVYHVLKFRTEGLIYGDGISRADDDEEVSGDRGGKGSGGGGGKKKKGCVIL